MRASINWQVSQRRNAVRHSFAHCSQLDSPKVFKAVHSSHAVEIAHRSHTKGRFLKPRSLFVACYLRYLLPVTFASLLRTPVLHFPQSSIPSWICMAKAAKARMS
jgi:hypothetical protein